MPGLTPKTLHAFTTTSPTFRKCVFLSFLIPQLATLYSGHPPYGGPVSRSRCSESKDLRSK